MEIDTCIQAIPDHVLDSAAGIQTVVYTPNGQAQLLVFNMKDPNNMHLELSNIEDNGKSSNFLRSSNISFYGMNNTPVEFIIDHMGNVSILVVGKDGHQVEGLTLISRIRTKYQSIEFEQINQRTAVFGFTINDITIFFRKQAYSSIQNDPSNPQIMIPAAAFPKTGNFNVIRRIAGNFETSKVVVTVQNTLNDIVNIESQIPPTHVYKDNQINRIDISRDRVSGNNLQFSLNDGKMVKNQDFLNVNSFQYTFDKEIDSLDDIFFTTESVAIGRIGNQLFLIKCELSYFPATGKCSDYSEGSDEYRYTLEAGEKVVYTTSTEFQNEAGSVAVVSNQTDSKFLFFGELFKEVYQTTRKGLAIKEGEVFFKFTGKHYAFFVQG